MKNVRHCDQSSAVRRIGWRTVLAVVLASLLLAAACGDDDEDAQGATSTVGTESGGTTTSLEATTTSLEPVEPLKVAIGSPTTLYGAAWVALGADLFEKHGVEVEVVNFNAFSTGSAQLASDQIDIMFSSPVVGLSLASEDIELSYIYRLLDNEYHLPVFATAKDVTIDELRAMGSDCRLSGPPAGGGIYMMGNHFLEAYELGCEYVPQDVTTAVPALISGQVQAVVSLPTLIFPAAEQGLVNLIYDPRTVSEAEGKRLVPFQHPGLLAYGKKETLAAKREAVVRFTAALQEASEVIMNSTAEEVANIAVKVEPFATAELAPFIQSWELTIAGIPSGDEPGRLSESEWSALLDAIPAWGVADLDVSDPRLSFDAVIDMSYYEEAAARG